MRRAAVTAREPAHRLGHRRSPPRLRLHAQGVPRRDRPRDAALRRDAPLPPRARLQAGARITEVEVRHHPRVLGTEQVRAGPDVQGAARPADGEVPLRSVDEAELRLRRQRGRPLLRSARSSSPGRRTSSSSTASSCTGSRRCSSASSCSRRLQPDPARASSPSSSSARTTSRRRSRSTSSASDRTSRSRRRSRAADARDVRHLRRRRPRPGRPRGARAHDATPAPSRAGRRRLLRRASTTTGRRSASASGAWRSSTSSRATSRSRTRTAPSSVVFNGEIYNFRELRARARGAGHRFATNADTEVIVHLYEDVGHALRRAPERDVRARALGRRAARAPARARPLRQEAALLRAASAARCSSAPSSRRSSQHPQLPDRARPRGLSRYLALEYVPTPRSIFDGVQQAARRPPPALARRARRRSSGTGTSRSRPTRPRVSDDEYAEELRALLRAAVRRRLVSDVPLGVFLCGGIDSSSVVAMMAAATAARDVKTFSIGFGERSFDESAHARRVAEHFGTDHHEEVFTPHVDARRCSRPSPTSSTSRSPTPRSCRRTCSRGSRASRSPSRSAATAATSCSPATRRSRPTASRDCTALPRAAPRARRRPARRRLPVSTANFSLDFKVKRFLRGAGAPADDRHATGSARSRRTSWPSCSTVPLPTPFAEQRRAFGVGSDARPARAADLPLRATYLQDDILVKVDRASMAVLARGARAVPRPRARRVPRARAAAAQAAPARHQVPAQARDGATCSRRGSPVAPRRASAFPSPSGSRASCASAPGRALAARIRRRGSSTRPWCSDWSPSTCRGDATTGSSSGPCSCSSCGTGAGSEAVPRSNRHVWLPPGTAGGEGWQGREAGLGTRWAFSFVPWGPGRGLLCWPERSVDC